MKYGPTPDAKYGASNVLDQPPGKLISRPAGGLQLPTSFLGLVMTQYANGWKKTDVNGNIIATANEVSFAEWANAAPDAGNDVVVVAERGHSAQIFEYESFGANRMQLASTSNYLGVCVDPETATAFMVEDGGDKVTSVSYAGAVLSSYTATGNARPHTSNPGFARLNGTPFVYYVSQTQYLTRCNMDSGVFEVLAYAGQASGASVMHDPVAERILVFDDTGLHSYGYDGSGKTTINPNGNGQRVSAAIDLVNYRVFGQGENIDNDHYDTIPADGGSWSLFKDFGSILVGVGVAQM